MSETKKTSRDSSEARPRYPMFKEGTNSELSHWADRLDVGVAYLTQVRDGSKTIGPRTKTIWAALAKSTTEEMFGEVPYEPPETPQEPVTETGEG